MQAGFAEAHGNNYALSLALVCGVTAVIIAAWTALGPERKNADFAALMKHGRKVADALGFQVDQNTFNPVVVDFYEQVGYLPEAIINYLALLGWSYDDRTEIMSRDELSKFSGPPVLPEFIASTKIWEDDGDIVLDGRRLAETIAGNDSHAR